MSSEHKEHRDQYELCDGNHDVPQWWDHEIAAWDSLLQRGMHIKLQQMGLSDAPVEEPWRLFNQTALQVAASTPSPFAPDPSLRTSNIYCCNLSYTVAAWACVLSG